MTKKNYKLNLTYDSAVTITESFDTYTSYLQVSVDIDVEKQKLGEWHYCIKRWYEDTIANWTSQPENYVSLESIEAAKKLIKKNFREVRAKIKEAQNHPAYPVMREIADLEVQHWKADFTYHDCLILGRINPTTFLWLVRSTGTDMYVYKQKELYEAISKTPLRERNQKGFFWNGKKLETIDLNDVLKYYQKLPDFPGN